MVEVDGTIKEQAQKMRTLVRRSADEGRGFWAGIEAYEYLQTEHALDKAIDQAWLVEPALSRRRLAALAERDGQAQDVRDRLREALAHDAVDRAIESNLRKCIRPGCDKWLSRSTHRDDAAYHSRSCQQRTLMSLRRAVATQPVSG